MSAPTEVVTCDETGWYSIVDESESGISGLDEVDNSDDITIMMLD